MDATTSRGPRERAYNLYFRKKRGEVIDLAGRALAATGLGAGFVSQLAANKLPRPEVWPTALAILGIALIYVGVSWQAGADADKENGDA